MTADGDEAPTCPHCGAIDGKRMVSRVAKFRTEDQRVDEMSERMERYDEPDSPSEARRLVREMGKALDDDASDEMEALYESDLEGGDDE